MAKRRLNSTLAGLGVGLSNVGDLLMRSHLQEKAQDRYDQRAAQNATAVAARQKDAETEKFIEALLAKVGEGFDPESAAAQMSFKTGQPVTSKMLEGVRPSPRRRMQTAVGGKIDAATKPELVPSDLDIQSAARLEGLQDVPNEMMVPDAQTDDPFAGFKPEVQEYGTRAGARRKALMSEPTEKFEVTDPNTGAVSTQFGNKYSGPVQTKPTSAQQGTLAGEQEAAKDTAVFGDDALNKLKGTAQGRIASIAEGLTRQAKVQTAAAVAGATERAKLAPDIIEAEVGKAKSIAEGAKQPTESERRAATNWTPLIKAHGAASALESKGVTLELGDLMRSDYPNSGLDPAQRQYAQAAKDFVSTLGLIRSGVTVRPDERDTLVSTMFSFAGDDDATKKAKLASREVYLAAMQAMVGRSADEAGAILAEAINRNQIPMSVLTSVQMEPAIEKALLTRLKNVPQFDANGRPKQ